MGDNFAVFVLHFLVFEWTVPLKYGKCMEIVPFSSMGILTLYSNEYSVMNMTVEKLQQSLFTLESSKISLG